MNQDVPFLDRQLTKYQTAAWMQMTETDLLKKHQAGIIRGFPVGRKTIRWNPRSVIAQLAKRAGLSFEVIAASFGLQQNG